MKIQFSLFPKFPQNLSFSIGTCWIYLTKFSSVQNETLARTDVILIICAPLNISSKKKKKLFSQKLRGKATPHFYTHIVCFFGFYSCLYFYLSSDLNATLKYKSLCEFVYEWKFVCEFLIFVLWFLINYLRQINENWMWIWKKCEKQVYLCCLLNSIYQQDSI